MATARTASAETSKLPRWLREPTLHFFALAGAALLGQRLMTGDPRTIELTPALKADLLRRYQDQVGRPPTNQEAQTLIANWKTDEALYREALRHGIDRDDADVRNLLIAKMRERLLLQTRLREPTDDDLRRYLEAHRDRFEAPLLFEHEYISFDRRDPRAPEQRARYQKQLSAGATITSLGLRSTVANVSRERIEQDFGREIADQVGKLTPGQWTELQTADQLLLVKLIGIQGGLPDPAALREQLSGAWKAAQAQSAVSRAAQSVAERYHFEEKQP